jgi:hypothetical protein
MSDLTNAKRRRLLQTTVGAAAGLAATELGLIETAKAERAPVPNQPTSPSVVMAMGPIRQVRTDVLDIGYFEAGPGDGRVVLLLHGWPYDIHSASPGSILWAPVQIM